MVNLEKRVESIVQPVIENLGYSLYDVEYTKEGKDYFLRIFIDKPSGIDLNDCETVNNAIDELLDEADCIKEAYFLEVSSPGIERTLRKDKHLQESVGKLVEIKLFKPIDKQKTMQGILKGFDKDIVKIESKEEIIVDRKNISLIKTVYEW